MREETKRQCSKSTEARIFGIMEKQKAVNGGNLVARVSWHIMANKKKSMGEQRQWRLETRGEEGRKEGCEGGREEGCEGEGVDRALWCKITRNPDLSTGPHARPLARLLAPLSHSLALHCLLRSHTPLRSFVCSLAYSLSSSWDSDP